MAGGRRTGSPWVRDLRAQFLDDRPGPTPPTSAAPAAAPGHPAALDAAVADRAETAQHCWVHDPPDHPGTWPALLITWRRAPDGWAGRVIWAHPGPEGLVVVEQWLPAAHLTRR